MVLSLFADGVSPSLERLAEKPLWPERLDDDVVEGRLRPGGRVRPRARVELDRVARGRGQIVRMAEQLLVVHEDPRLAPAQLQAPALAAASRARGSGELPRFP